MTDHWADLLQFRADGRRVIRWIVRQGVAMCDDPTEQKRARDILLPVFWALEDVIRPVPLVALYLYRQADQLPSLRTTSGTPMRDVDGISWRDVTADRGSLHAIGVSCEAIDKGATYAQMVFIHELTHIFAGGEHNTEFHKLLDRLIARFNAATGSSLVNDRFGLQMRHDSRSYDPFQIAGTPPPPCVGGRAFRTEAIQDGQKRP